MKKQFKSLALKKETISSLEAKLLLGGAPTTMTVNTFASGCQSQKPCDPVPIDPRPKTDDSICRPCTLTSWNRPTC